MKFEKVQTFEPIKVRRISIFKRQTPAISDGEAKKGCNFSASCLEPDVLRNHELHFSSIDSK